MSAICLDHEGVEGNVGGPAAITGGRNPGDLSLSALLAGDRSPDGAADRAPLDGLMEYRRVPGDVYRPVCSDDPGPFRGGAVSSILATRRPLTYTDAERALSAFLSRQLQALLSGQLDAMPLMRKYHRETGRLGIPGWAGASEGGSVRVHVAEEMLTRVLLFVHGGSPGGPITQAHDDSGLIERQSFSTPFPHIIVERQDRYHAVTREPLETEWTIRRIQNQHTETRVNRALDIAGLGLEIVKILL